MSIEEVIAAEARSWIGTPFFPHQAIKGVGADCVQGALQIFKNAKAIPEDVVLPDYNISAGQYLLDSLVIQWLSRSPYFVPVSESPSMGNIVTMREGRVVHHVGVMTSNSTFVQATQKYGMVERDLQDQTWKHRLRSVWKVKI